MIQAPGNTAAPLPAALNKYLKTTDKTKLCCLIYGDPVTGKTTGARTFPNPVVVDFDNNMPAGITNVIPMWDEKFVDTIVARKVPAVANRRDALNIVLADLAREMPADSTIIVDSITRVEHWYNLQEEKEPKPVSEKTRKIDVNAQFRARLEFFLSLFVSFSSAKANIVFIAHSQRMRDDDGDLTNQLKPALMGQAGDRMPGYFPILLQAVRRQQDPAKKESPIEYKWRIRSSTYEPARVPKDCGLDFIPQQYSELIKYV